MKNIEERPLEKIEYEIDHNKIVTIKSGKFQGIKLSFTNFEIDEDTKSDNYLSYDYSIIEGDINLNEGEEIKMLMRTIIYDIIINYKNTEE